MRITASLNLAPLGGVVHRFERLPLVAQVMLAGLLAGGLTLAARWGWPGENDFHPGWTGGAWGFGLWLVPLVVASWPAHRAAQALRRVCAATRLLTRDEPPDDAQIPYESRCGELHEATVALRRGVDAARRRRLALLAQNAALGVKLQSRTQELSDLTEVHWQVRQPQQGRLRVADDGCGFDPKLPNPGHFGLDSIRERALALGADLVLRSAASQGTEIVLDVNWS